MPNWMLSRLLTHAGVARSPRTMSSKAGKKGGKAAAAAATPTPKQPQVSSAGISPILTPATYRFRDRRGDGGSLTPASAAAPRYPDHLSRPRSGIFFLASRVYPLLCTHTTHSRNCLSRSFLDDEKRCAEKRRERPARGKGQLGLPTRTRLNWKL